MGNQKHICLCAILLLVHTQLINLKVQKSQTQLFLLAKMSATNSKNKLLLDFKY